MSISGVDPNTITFPFQPWPTFAGFQSYVWNVAGFPQDALPPNAEIWIWAYNTATATVNEQIEVVPGPQYLQAVYFLGTDFIVNWAPDQPGVFYPSPPAPPPTVDGNPTTNTGFFAWLRNSYNITGFFPGFITASNDQGTGSSYMVPKTFDNYNIGNLQQLKTPWGRAYLAIASSVGSLWGLT
jgi:hypothetical protein